MKIRLTFVALCLSTAIFFFLKNNEKNVEDLFIDNLEAIASTEGPSYYCSSGGSIKCNGSGGYSAIYY